LPVRVLVALGGNAMTAADGTARPEDQRAAVAVAVEGVADLVAAGHDVIITHGNGPQVGNLLVKNEVAADVVPPVPLDWCVAQTQATLGMLLIDALDAVFARRGIDRKAAALVTRVRVDPSDRGFQEPTKPIGRYVSADDAAASIARGQTWREQGARGWRRVVASPEPLEIIDAAAIAALVDAGFLVVASGGGGIPVVPAEDGAGFRGVEAVIDKDLSAALLARSVRADVLVIATDVEQAMIGYGTPEAAAIGLVEPAQLREYAAEGHFGSGSMGPKVEAAVRFVEAGGHHAAITSLPQIAAAAEGSAGTVVRAEAHAGVPA
jgi:carbamate kinase